jgi:hypothetical protein
MGKSCVHTRAEQGQWMRFINPAFTVTSLFTGTVLRRRLVIELFLSLLVAAQVVLYVTVKELIKCNENLAKQFEDLHKGYQDLVDYTDSQRTVINDMLRSYK